MKKKTLKRSRRRNPKKTLQRRNRSKRLKKKSYKKKRGGFVRDGSIQHFITCLGKIVMG
jgi:hypothetical protein